MNLSKKTLVIVESPGKIKTIQKILGDNYIIKASFGHCRDLDSKHLSIDVTNNYKPQYVITNNKIVKDLKDNMKNVSEVILAMDEDREGEMIASSLRDILNLKDPKRIVFNEITNKAILESIKNPTKINEDMVFSQQTRRLLDRLVGYKLSPLLWKAIKGETSAGRVQSVALRITIDKEKEIEQAESSVFFKTMSTFKYNNITLNSTLMLNNNIYKFSDRKTIKTFLKKLNSNNVNKVIDIVNKKSKKSPSPPFITSSLQQEASTKLGYPSKYTMSIAQKLYESGYITYMRTDSTNLSDDILNQCKTFICSKYGEKYYKRNKYNKKVKGGQEAHEAIRPTKVLTTVDDIKLSDEYKRLYNLIWKRTVACQMANAKINIQTIFIDILSNFITILPDKSKFTCIFENIIFDGFLTIYNTYENDNNDGKIDINIDNLVNFDSMKISEEYTKLPLRYNEAGLIKYLEKNGIGRPSTYSSIISKILDKKYVEIKDIKGKEVDSNIILVNDNYIAKKKVKKVKLGSEKKKIIPTETGISINKFLLENFETIMDINFTVNLEKELDKIVNGKAKWYNILDMYYKTFNPMVIELENKYKTTDNIKNSDSLFGYHPESNKEIYKGAGKFGPYIKILNDDNKWKFASIKDIDNPTIDNCYKLLEYPKYIGKINKSTVTLNKGKFGLYFKVGNKKISIKDETKELNLDYAKLLNNTDDPYALKTFNFDNKKIYLKQGPYGYFLKVKFKSNKTKNISLPGDIDVDTFDISNFIKN